MKRSTFMAVVALIVIGVAAAWYLQTTSGPEPSVADAVSAPEPDSATTETTATPDPPAAPSGQAEGPPEVPTFDIVRVEPSGETVVAGRAAPGSQVQVLDGETVLGTVTAGPSGDWVLVPETPLSPGGHELSLRATDPANPETEAFTSTDKAPAAVAEASQGGAAGDGLGSGETTRQSDDVVLVVVPEPKAGAAPETAVAVLAARDGEGASRILQGPGEGIMDHDLLLNTVDYDDQGRVTLSGAATAGAILVVYLDNAPLGDLVVGSQGQWSFLVVQQVTPGLHTFRIDMLGPDGTVVARVETPFERSTLVAGLEGQGFVVVQPGNSLWRIARRSYGKGMHYTEIHAANQHQIADPHLIYPGQVFIVPKMN